MTTERDLDIECIDRVRAAMGPDIAGLAAAILDLCDPDPIDPQPER